MEKAKTFCRKKRSVAKSMVSLMLIFAMVISNVQITPDAFPTVWAAESETSGTSEASENSSQSDDAVSDGEEAGEASENSGDDRNTGTEETDKSTQESEIESPSREEDAAQSEAVTETSKQTEEEDTTKETATANDSTESIEDSGSGDSILESAVEETSEDSNESSIQETETTTDVTESTTEEETTETETTEDENISADEAVGETVDVVVHFKNTLAWDAVRIHSWVRKTGEGDTNVFEENAGKLLEEQEGYYSYTFERIELDDSFEFIGFLFNKSQTDNWASEQYQTTNVTISKSELINIEDGKYECWICLTNDNREDGQKLIPQVSRVGLSGPEISSDGAQVTFRYHNANASQVTIRGVKGDTWSGDAEVDQTMDKDSATGIFTSTISLPEEGFSYKFVVKYDGSDTETWIFDPSNLNIVNGNSYVRKGSEKAVIRFHFKNVLEWDEVSMHYWGMGIDGTNWPGSALDLSESNKDEKGYYTFDINADGLIHDLGFIVTDGKDSDTLQTINNTISHFDILDNDTYELWVWLDENKKNEQGHYIPNISTSPLSSPEFGEMTEEGTQVTFRYQQESGAPDRVLLAGTMTDWLEAPVEMNQDENGIWSCTVSLPHGEYEYKYVIPKAGESNPGTDGAKYDWYFDPFNTNYSTHKENDQVIKDNSLVYVAGEEYTYTVHYYNPANKASTADESDLYIWEPGITYTDTAKIWEYETIETDANEIPWQTVCFKVPYKAMGIIGRPSAGSWTGQDANQYYQLKQLRNGAVDEAKTAEFWYIHGQGIYESAPNMGHVTNLSASFGNADMDYTQNNVLHINATDSEGAKVFVKEAYVNASGLGISEKLYIAPELMEVTLSVTEDTPCGTVELPITVVDYQGNTVRTSATVNVVAKTKDENDFDWDEAVIYFMVTDRFEDGDASNNEKAGTDTFNKSDPGLYHGRDFAGVKEHLKDLKDLGVNTIWITPIVKNIPKVQVEDGKGEIPNYASYHGYWASDFADINGALGTKDEFQELINAVHAEGMKLMVDVVVNHAGYGAEEGETFSGMLREAAIEDDAFHGGGGQAGLPDFMTENPEIRDMIIGWQLDWAKMGVDYFRVDTVKHVDNTT